jgi:hypothetical protein
MRRIINRRVHAVAVLTFAAISWMGMAAKETTVEELKARLSSAGAGERPRLCLEIAQKQLDAADRSYVALDSEKGQAALTDVVAFSELARDYAVQSHKHQKQIEIEVRKMIRKLIDVKNAASHDDQLVLQNAIDRLQKVRDDLLFSMFPKGEKK